MKHITLTILFLIIGLNLFSQKLGEDYSPYLNENEILFFNKIFNDSIEKIDLKNKKVAFSYESYPILTKRKYFNFYTSKSLNEKKEQYETLLISLNSEEKIKSGNYDYIILIKHTNISKEKILPDIFIQLKNIEKRTVVPLDSIGIDNNNVLTIYESRLLNNELLEKRKNFDFSSKKIAFFYGDGSRKQWSKKDYFIELRDAITENTFLGDQLLILTEQEKSECGYDAFIISWSKMMGNKKRIIKKLKNKNKA